MINYKSFKVGDGAKLRVKTENIIATMSSKNSASIDLYIVGLDRPLHIPVTDNSSATELMDYIWERSRIEDMEEI